MNEIIATIVAGLPEMLLVVAIVVCVSAYAFVLDKVLDTEHSAIIGFVLVFGVFMFCMALAYGFGSVI